MSLLRAARKTSMSLNPSQWETLIFICLIFRGRSSNWPQRIDVWGSRVSPVSSDSSAISPRVQSRLWVCPCWSKDFQEGSCFADLERDWGQRLRAERKSLKKRIVYSISLIVVIRISYFGIVVVFHEVAWKIAVAGEWNSFWLALCRGNLWRAGGGNKPEGQSTFRSDHLSPGFWWVSHSIWKVAVSLCSIKKQGTEMTMPWIKGCCISNLISTGLSVTPALVWNRNL